MSLYWIIAKSKSATDLMVVDRIQESGGAGERR